MDKSPRGTPLTKNRPIPRWGRVRTQFPCAVFSGEAEEAARKLGVELQPLEVRGPDDFEAVFATARRGNAQALIVFDDVLTLTYRHRFVPLAAGSRLPTIYGLREFPDDGGLMSYGANVADLLRRSATFVDRIPRGRHKPADLPVERPTIVRVHC